ncbi:MAG: hypothetical protein HQ518_19835 [Rhodopirellula sp.]|nr:hypothetical protein [Rhodopirellula sp.]
MPRSRISHESRAEVANERRCCIALLAIATLIALHPISTHDFWWQLSRGRVVVDGTLAPAQVLLAGETTASADWLGGMPIYALFSLGGIAALMGLKLLAASVVGLDLLFRQAPRRNAVSLAVVLLALLAARQAWEPTPLLFDTLGVTLVWSLVDQLQNRPSRRCLVLLLIAMSVWANIAPLCVLGIFVAVSAMLVRSQSSPSLFTPRRGGRIVMLMVVACCVTPRGVATLWDSIRLLVPLLTTSASVLQSTPWSPLALTIHNPECLAFVALSLALFFVLLQSRLSVSTVLTCCVIQLLAWSSQSNLAPGSIWMTLLLLRQLQADQVPALQVFKNRLLAEFAGKILPAGAVLLVAAAAVGSWPESISRAGWGIDPSISGVEFVESVQDVRTTGSAHCVGIREAGLLCWFKPEGAKPFDTPRHALLNGRLRQNVLLNQELSTGWQIPHRREDDSWGGWWLTLKERTTTLLIVPSDDTDLIRALEPTIWKPLSLSGASLVFGVAGDPACSPQIARILQLREHFDQSVWSYDPVSATGDEAHCDLVGLLTGNPTFEADLRLAETFRAMHLNVAALRVLSPVLRNGNRQVARDEFARSQLELGYSERLALGQSSLLRAIAFQETSTNSDAGHLVAEALNPPLMPDRTVTGKIQTAVRAFAAGETDRAIELLTDEQPELVYARAQLLFEAGRPGESISAYQTLITKFPESRLSIVGRNVLTSL